MPTPRPDTFAGGHARLGRLDAVIERVAHEPEHAFCEGLPGTRELRPWFGRGRYAGFSRASFRAGGRLPRRSRPRKCCSCVSRCVAHASAAQAAQFRRPHVSSFRVPRPCAHNRNEWRALVATKLEVAVVGGGVGGKAPVGVETPRRKARALGPDTSGVRAFGARGVARKRRHDPKGSTSVGAGRCENEKRGPYDLDRQATHTDERAANSDLGRRRFEGCS